MKTFDYTIKDPIGIHARPAGLLGKKAKEFESSVVIASGDKEAAATKLMALMQLGIKSGQTVTVKVDGPDEDACADAIKEFLEANL